MKNTEQKYFTPNQEDFHIGYVCEIATESGYKEGIFPELLSYNPELNEFGNDEFMKLAHTVMRTPHLSVEQIVSEGWNYNSDRFLPKNQQENLKGFSKEDYYLVFTPQQNSIQLRRLMDEHIQNSIVLYEGQCPCINTFRKLMKLLIIK